METEGHGNDFTRIKRNENITAIPGNRYSNGKRIYLCSGDRCSQDFLWGCTCFLEKL